MAELELHMLKSMNGGPDIKIEKIVKLSSGDDSMICHICDSNPNGVPADIQLKHIRHAVTETEGTVDILKRNNKNSKWKLESYHHMSFKQMKVRLTGSASELSSLPTGKKTEIINDN